MPLTDQATRELLTRSTKVELQSRVLLANAQALLERVKSSTAKGGTSAQQ